MNKRYRLIRQYPGSPNLDVIIDLSRENWVDDVFLYKSKYWIYNITSNPEFWLELDENQYEILSFRSKKGKNIISSKPEWDKDFFEVNKKEWEIYSVKRLDGEIFTLEDVIGNKFYTDSIKKFIIVRNYIHVTIDTNSTIGINISDIEKINESKYSFNEIFNKLNNNGCKVSIETLKDIFNGKEI